MISAASPKRVFQLLASPLKRNRSKNRLQRYLDLLLASQGYPSTRKHSTDSTQYCTKATAFDKGSFGDRVSEAVKRNDHGTLRSMINAGISPNPYTKTSGEYLTNIVCREGKNKMLETMIELGGTDILLCIDQYGRTPLHNICMLQLDDTNLDIWLDVASLIIHCDPTMILMKDCNENDPLKYVTREHHERWMQMLDNIKNTVWPMKTKNKNQKQVIPIQTTVDDNSSIHDTNLFLSPFRSPSKVGSRKLPLEAATMLASGRLSEVEIGLFQHTGHMLSPSTDCRQQQQFADTTTFKSNHSQKTFLDEEDYSVELLSIVDELSDDGASIRTTDFAFDFTDLIDKIESNTK